MNYNDRPVMATLLIESDGEAIEVTVCLIPRTLNYRLPDWGEKIPIGSKLYTWTAQWSERRKS